MAISRDCALPEASVPQPNSALLRGPPKGWSVGQASMASRAASKWWDSNGSRIDRIFLDDCNLTGALETAIHRYNHGDVHPVISIPVCDLLYREQAASSPPGFPKQQPEGRFSLFRNTSWRVSSGDSTGVAPEAERGGTLFLDTITVQSQTTNAGLALLTVCLQFRTPPLDVDSAGLSNDKMSFPSQGSTFLFQEPTASSSDMQSETNVQIPKAWSIGLQTSKSDAPWLEHTANGVSRRQQGRLPYTIPSSSKEVGAGDVPINPDSRIYSEKNDGGGPIETSEGTTTSTYSSLVGSKRPISVNGARSTIVTQTPKAVKTKHGQSATRSSQRGPFHAALDELCSVDGQSTESSSLWRYLHFTEDPARLFLILDEAHVGPPRLDPEHTFAQFRGPLILDALTRLVSWFDRADGRDCNSTKQDVHEEEYWGSDSEKLSSGDNRSRKRFACPLYARDPESHVHCLTAADLKSILDIERHICRDHGFPRFCPICNATFEDSLSRDDHIREQLCSPLPKPNFQGVGAENMYLLARVREDIPVADQWKAISNIVAPGHKFSQPVYLEGGMESAVVRAREFWDRQGRSIVFRFLADRIRGMKTEYTIPDEERNLQAMYEDVGRSVVEITINCYQGLGGTSRQTLAGMANELESTDREHLERLQEALEKYKVRQT
ncbi:hypothetical protein MKZ38_001767 [Zalerion maritima]|uniref:C2H2-type domain-containing protein n=1 Tax=Zalerion maritima TaxID=339359 RepID=A0AAD5RXN6_9PEZI|nr:hypothetical protein MKZ38_001767 [Zalerion maritima]